MSGRQKLLLAVLAGLLVVLYLVAVGGGRHDRGDPAARPGWLTRLGGGTAVDPATVEVDCAPPAAPPSPSVAGTVVTFRTGCVLRVADPGGLRTLVLRSRAPFEVTAPAPRGAQLTVHDEVAPGDDGTAEATVAVDRRTEVVLGCPGGDGCTVTVARS
ncbi:hypothetical protein ACGFI9_02105 [Micromonospora sp. NPDC048930]|uniref:hypothetical protein n=1 Tax=Micromonospora sp. NPDC048930 TaxID=3364261 RepID=UPI003717C223